jgi:hypothetical protein
METILPYVLPPYKDGLMDGYKPNMEKKYLLGYGFILCKQYVNARFIYFNFCIYNFP